MPKDQERPRVLMIEDDDDFQALVRDWLAPEYDVMSLGSGEDILAEVQEADPDLVILDVKLPGPDGFRLCKKMRSHPRFSEMPVLFLTGCSEDADFLKGLRSGGTAYLNKPVSRKELLEKVREMVAQTSGI